MVKNGFNRRSVIFFQKYLTVEVQLKGRTCCVYSELKSLVHEWRDKLTKIQLNFFSIKRSGVIPNKWAGNNVETYYIRPFFMFFCDFII